jgi:hypothetical protein
MSDLERELRDACFEAYNLASDKHTARQVIEHIKTRLIGSGLLKGAEHEEQGRKEA